MSDFNDNLRQQLQQYVDNSGETYYQIAKESGVPTQVIYAFRNKGGGLNAENAARLVNHMNIKLKDLI